MSIPITGSDLKVNLEPGVDMYFYTMATVDAFKSDIQHLVVPERAQVPEYGIDFVNETTDKPVPSTDEYATTSSFNGAQDGDGTILELTPGSDMYFRTKASETTFISLAQKLEVPNRPFISSSESDTTAKSPFSIYVVFFEDVTGFEIEDIIVDKGEVDNLRSNYIADITASDTGLLSVYVTPNVVDEGNFISNVFSIYYNGEIENPDTSTTDTSSTDTTYISLENTDLFDVYPNPSNGVVYLKNKSEFGSCISVIVTCINGQVVFENDYSATEIEKIDLNTHSKGVYILQIRHDKGIETRRLIIH
jgi:hypothetical protein